MPFCCTILCQLFIVWTKYIHDGLAIHNFLTHPQELLKRLPILVTERMAQS